MTEDETSQEDEEGPHQRGNSERARHKAKAEQREAELNEPLTIAEREQVGEHRRLSSRTVYLIILAEGEEELSRPSWSLIWSLIWSGIAAGVGISTSVLAEEILHAKLGDISHRHLVENFGYSLGFVLVILSRLQLFTGNTLSVVLPLLFRPSRDKLLNSGRLWGLVLTANLLGTAVTALMTLWPGTVEPWVADGMIAVSLHFAEVRGWDALLLGIPAGFLIAAIVWMLPSAKGFEIFVILVFTYLIALGDFTHVIAGATEVFLLIFSGNLSVYDGVVLMLLPTLAGNIIGGTGLFALLAHAQVRDEV